MNWVYRLLSQLTSFKASAWPASKLADDFEAGQAVNWTVTYTLYTNAPILV